jgi:hypothetical protein
MNHFRNTVAVHVGGTHRARVAEGRAGVQRLVACSRAGPQSRVPGLGVPLVVQLRVNRQGVGRLRAGRAVFDLGRAPGVFGKPVHVKWFAGASVYEVRGQRLGFIPGLRARFGAGGAQQAGEYQDAKPPPHARYVTQCRHEPAQTWPAQEKRGPDRSGPRKKSCGRAATWRTRSAS